ncbi:MAG: DUF3455 domain-containing protein [Acidobacteria bacterium]|nr:DUF3455 domain-containing protein [Acidobacteriota bacterium]
MLPLESSYTAPVSRVFALNPATTPGASALLFTNETLPPAIQVDQNHNRLLTSRIGVGVQIYDYHSTNGGWVFREPQADLYHIETGIQLGIHFAGPYWADADGSRVKGKTSGEADAPIDSNRNVKWLRLDAVENFGSNTGIFRQVAFIQRVFTYGGRPPSKREPTDGDTVSVPYTALYVFWAQKKP